MHVLKMVAISATHVEKIDIVGQNFTHSYGQQTKTSKVDIGALIILAWNDPGIYISSTDNRKINNQQFSIA